MSPLYAGGRAALGSVAVEGAGLAVVAGEQDHRRLLRCDDGVDLLDEGGPADLLAEVVVHAGDDGVAEPIGRDEGEGEGDRRQTQCQP